MLVRGIVTARPSPRQGKNQVWYHQLEIEKLVLSVPGNLAGSLPAVGSLVEVEVNGSSGFQGRLNFDLVGIPVVVASLPSSNGQAAAVVPVGVPVRK